MLRRTHLERLKPVHTMSGHYQATARDRNGGAGEGVGAAPAIQRIRRETYGPSVFPRWGRLCPRSLILFSALSQSP